MKIVYNFKDGVKFESNDYGKDFKHEGDFLQMIKRGQENNSAIRFTDNDGREHEKRYEEIYSIELVL